MRAKVKETYSSAIEVASAIRERSPRRVYVIGSGTSSYSALAASYAAFALASPDELSVLAKAIQVPIRDRYLLTPLLTPPRAQHAETSGNH
jgi:fructoselysine-6-P-deglycase FrlB-like protein